MFTFRTSAFTNLIMKILSALACTTLVLLHSSAFAVVVFEEGFDSPLITGANPNNMSIASTPSTVPVGEQSFDNAGWVVINTADADPSPFGVFLTTDPGLMMGTGQALAFGGANTSGNSVSILIEGFDEMELPSITFEHRQIGTSGQTMEIVVTDPEDGFDTVLYSKTGITGDSAVPVDENFALSPTGNTVIVTITQTGTTTNSDGSIDNLTITAIPEPSLAILGALGVLIGLIRRRR